MSGAQLAKRWMVFRLHECFSSFYGVRMIRDQARVVPGFKKLRHFLSDDLKFFGRDIDFSFYGLDIIRYGWLAAKRFDSRNFKVDLASDA